MFGEAFTTDWRNGRPPGKMPGPKWILGQSVSALRLGLFWSVLQMTSKNFIAATDQQATMHVAIHQGETGGLDDGFLSQILGSDRIQIFRSYEVTPPGVDHLPNVECRLSGRIKNSCRNGVDMTAFRVALALYVKF